MSSAIGFRHPLDVRFFEVDSRGVVFNKGLPRLANEAMSAFIESIGYDLATLRARLLDVVLRRAELEWLTSLQAFEHAEVAVRADHVGTTSFRLRFDIERVDGSGQVRTRCAQAAITYVCVEIAGRSTRPILDGLLEALAGDCR